MTEGEFYATALNVWAAAPRRSGDGPVGSVTIRHPDGQETYTFPPDGEPGSVDLTLIVRRQPLAGAST